MSKPLFQKRHYEVIAQTLSYRSGNNTVSTHIMALVEVFKKDNPKFNEDKFWRAINDKN